MTRILVAVLICLGLCACASAPPLGRDLPAASKDANFSFDERVKARFAVGSPESALLAELMRENFKLSPCADPTGAGCEFQRFADFKQPSAACQRDWQVLWDLDGAQISKIEGRYYLSCP